MGAVDLNGIGRAARILLAGAWDVTREVDVVLLDFDLRHRRRLTLTTVAGARILLDLPEAARLREGDGLMLDDGGIVRVRACPEPLLEIRARSPGELARFAWHLGNRHLPMQVSGETLRVREDHVIADMLATLGADLAPVRAPFDPEPGAYARGGHHHGYERHHDDDAAR
jgi:urease accessory protein